MTKVLRIHSYLSHILGAIERIHRYTAEVDLAGFMDNELVQDAVIRNIEVIGEASNNVQRVDPEFATRHSHIPWLVMYTMRNRVSHGYDKVDLEIVWKTIRGDLPALHKQIAEARATLTSNPDSENEP